MAQSYQSLRRTRDTILVSRPSRRDETELRGRGRMQEDREKVSVPRGGEGGIKFMTRERLWTFHVV